MVKSKENVLNRDFKKHSTFFYCVSEVYEGSRDDPTCSWLPGCVSVQVRVVPAL